MNIQQTNHEYSTQATSAPTTLYTQLQSVYEYSTDRPWIFNTGNISSNHTVNIQRQSVYEYSTDRPWIFNTGNISSNHTVHTAAVSLWIFNRRTVNIQHRQHQLQPHCKYSTFNTQSASSCEWAFCLICLILDPIVDFVTNAQNLAQMFSSTVQIFSDIGPLEIWLWCLPYWTSKWPPPPTWIKHVVSFI